MTNVIVSAIATLMLAVIVLAFVLSIIFSLWWLFLLFIPLWGLIYAWSASVPYDDDPFVRGA